MALSGDLSYKRQGRHIEPSGTLGNAICRYKENTMELLFGMREAKEMICECIETDLEIEIAVPPGKGMDPTDAVTFHPETQSFSVKVRIQI